LQYDINSICIFEGWFCTVLVLFSWENWKFLPVVSLENRDLGSGPQFPVVDPGSTTRVHYLLQFWRSRSYVLKMLERIIRSFHWIGGLLKTNKYKTINVNQTFFVTISIQKEKSKAFFWKRNNNKISWHSVFIYRTIC
jgi:hypothetical protein